MPARSGGKPPVVAAAGAGSIVTEQMRGDQIMADGDNGGTEGP